jgi:hypothetical protein
MFFPVLVCLDRVKSGNPALSFCSILINFDTKLVLATVWAIFFTNASGHPDYESPAGQVCALHQQSGTCVQVQRAWQTIKDAGWYICIPKIPILEYFGRSWNGKCCHTLWPFGIFYVLPFGISFIRPFGIFYIRPFGTYNIHTSIWYILWPIGIFFAFRFVAPRKLWQPRRP